MNLRQHTIKSDNAAPVSDLAIAVKQLKRTLESESSVAEKLEGIELELTEIRMHLSELSTKRSETQNIYYLILILLSLLSLGLLTFISGNLP